LFVERRAALCSVVNRRCRCATYISLGRSVEDMIELLGEENGSEDIGEECIHETFRSQIRQYNRCLLKRTSKSMTVPCSQHLTGSIQNNCLIVHSFHHTSVPEHYHATLLSPTLPQTRSLLQIPTHIIFPPMIPRIPFLPRLWRSNASMRILARLVQVTCSRVD
jgi:hypothetical protein